MRETLIQLKDLDSPQAVHDAVSSALQFPDYYGGNLDALWDCLGDLQLPVRIAWEEDGSLTGEALEAAQSILAVLQEFSLEEPDFQLSVVRKDKKG